VEGGRRRERVGGGGRRRPWPLGRNELRTNETLSPSIYTEEDYRRAWPGPIGPWPFLRRAL
jgi:hypothetical protein